jgi:hypothetical protein
MGDTSSAKGHSSRIGTILDSPGPTGLGPQYEKTPGPLGVCDQLDPTFTYDEDQKDEKKKLIKKKFEICIEILGKAIKFTKEKIGSSYRKENIKDCFKVPNNDDKALQDTAKTIVEVLEKIQAKMISCDLVIEIRPPGIVEKYSIWVRQNIWKNVDKGAEAIAQAQDGKIILYNPAFFGESGVDTLIHEFAHLVGIKGDIRPVPK